MQTNTFHLLAVDANEHIPPASPKGLPSYMSLHHSQHWRRYKIPLIWFCKTLCWYKLIPRHKYFNSAKKDQMRDRNLTDWKKKRERKMGQLSKEIQKTRRAFVLSKRLLCNLVRFCDKLGIFKQILDKIYINLGKMGLTWQSYIPLLSSITMTVLLFIWHSVSLLTASE